MFPKIKRTRQVPVRYLSSRIAYFDDSHKLFAQRQSRTSRLLIKDRQFICHIFVIIWFGFCLIAQRCLRPYRNFYFFLFTPIPLEYRYKNQVQTETVPSKVRWLESIIPDSLQFFFGRGAIGPEFGLKGALGYLYLNLLYGAEFIHANFSNSSNSANIVYSPMKIGVGYKISLDENFQLGAEVAFRSLPDWVIEKMMSSAFDKKIDGGFASETRGTFGMTYYFPEIKSYGRNKVEQLIPWPDH